MMKLKKCNEETDWNGFHLKPGHWYGDNDGQPVVTNGLLSDEDYMYLYRFENGAWLSSSIDTSDYEITAEVSDGDAEDPHPDMKFSEFLEEEYGVSWNEYDENFSPSQQDAINEEYEWKKTGLPFFARDYHKEA